jgi:rod shape determining protein RodA
MFSAIKRDQGWLGGVDWFMLLALVPIITAGLVTIHSYGDIGNLDVLMVRQVIFSVVGILLALFLARIDSRVLSRSQVVTLLYIVGLVMLLLLIPFGVTVNGARSWFDIGIVSFQPSDVMKLLLIILLAKYLSRRHVEISRIRHILITGLYFIIPFLLVFFQPDFGSAAILLVIWIGIILVAGISWKHLIVLLGIAIGAAVFVFFFVFKPYQQDRVMTFLNPTADIQGSGYNSYQSKIAVGSGQLLGKGVGYGTQSRLQFLPEHQTDFIFASFAEEWGFIGALLLLFLYAFVVTRILLVVRGNYGNFVKLYALGLSLYFVSHIFINIGMNVGLLPVTGITLPFMSAGGSHILVEFAGIGILFAMRRGSLRRGEYGMLIEEEQIAKNT